MKEINDICDVIIVGGGLAGVKTAHILAQNGFSVILLEAKNRLGGRTETVLVDAVGFDVGAQWVGPPELQPKIHKLISDLGLKTIPQFTEGKGLLSFGRKIYEYEGEVSTSVKGFDKYNEIIDRLDKISNKVSLQDPIGTLPESDDFMKYSTPAEWLSEQCSSPEDKTIRAMFDGSIRCLFTCEPDEICWSFFLFAMKSGGNYSTHSDTHNCAQHATIVGGTQQISELLGTQLRQMKNAKVMLNAIVQNVTQTSSGVTVLYEENSQFLKVYGKYVVIAVPPPMASRISYRPSLPPLRDMLTQQMRMGSVIKCFIFYAKPFWRDLGYSGEIFTDKGPICNYYDASTDNQHAALIGFIAGKHALFWTNKTKESRKQAIVDQLASFLGEAANHPTGYLEKNWLEDPFSRGAYMALMPPNIIRFAGHTLQEPVGRLYWAGTETSSLWYGYMEGALRSSENVTDKLLKLLCKSKL